MPVGSDQQLLAPVDTVTLNDSGSNFSDVNNGVPKAPIYPTIFIGVCH